MFDRNGDGVFRATRRPGRLVRGQGRAQRHVGRELRRRRRAERREHHVQAPRTTASRSATTWRRTSSPTASPAVAGAELRAHWMRRETIVWPATSHDGAATRPACTSLGGRARPGRRARSPARRDCGLGVDGGLDAAPRTKSEPRASPRSRSRPARSGGSARSSPGSSWCRERDGRRVLSAFTGVQIAGRARRPLRRRRRHDAARRHVARGEQADVRDSGRRPPRSVDAARSGSRHAPPVRPGRTGDGAWSAGRGATDGRARRATSTLWEVEVYAPTTGAIETNVGDRPVLGRAHARTRSAPWSSTSTTTCARSPSGGREDASRADRRSPGRPRDLRAARARLLDQRRDRARGAARHVPRLHRRDSRRHARSCAQLADAGINTVHLLPTFDIATIEENRAAQAARRATWRRSGRHPTEQQACVDGGRATRRLQLGLRPVPLHGARGLATPSTRTAARASREFREMVEGAARARACGRASTRSTTTPPASGQDAKSVLDRIVPGYYQRLNADGNVETSTCCQNTATEHEVAEADGRLGACTWATEYKVDGFRFDLMGHHSKREHAGASAPRSTSSRSRTDGVDGKAIYLYGEGWNFGEVAEQRLLRAGHAGPAWRHRHRHVHRPAARRRARRRPGRRDPRDQGFGTGLVHRPERRRRSTARRPSSSRGCSHADRPGQARPRGQPPRLRVHGLGRRRVARRRASTTTAQPAGYADQPDEVDQLRRRARQRDAVRPLDVQAAAGTSMADRVRMNTLSLATVTLVAGRRRSGTPAPSCCARSRSTATATTRATGSTASTGPARSRLRAPGLPPSADNEAKWPIMEPAAREPGAEAARSRHRRGARPRRRAARIRFSSRLFRLGSAAEIQQRVSFPASEPGVIAMKLDERIVVVFNATPEAVKQPVGAGRWTPPPGAGGRRRPGGQGRALRGRRVERCRRGPSRCSCAGQ